MGIKKAEILDPSATKQDQDKAQNSNKQYYMAEPASGKDEANSAFRSAPRAGKMSPAYLLGISCVRPARKNSLTDQTCSVKMAGYWSRSLLCCY